MAFKFVVLTTLLACANAGFISQPAISTYSAAPAVRSSYIQQAAPLAVAHAAPVISSYSASPVAIHAPTYGASHQSVERSLGGAQSVSHYSKAEDSAFSSVRKYDTRITNDALSVAHAPIATYSAAPVAYAAHAAPVATYSATPVAYAAHAAPVATYSAGPVAYAAHAAPVATYSAGPVLAKTVAPVAYSSPVVSTYAHAPVATYAAHAAPVAYSAGPVVTKAAIAYSPAAVVSHATFTGLGASYQW